MQNKKAFIVILAGLWAGIGLAFGQVPDSTPRQLMSELRTDAAQVTPTPGDSDLPIGSDADLKEFSARSAALDTNDLEGHLTLARWARDRGLWAQAVALAQAALGRDPGNKAAYLIMQQADDARPLTEESKTELSLKTQFAALFHHDFKTRISKHFLFCYDTSDTFAAQRGTGMEQVYDAFQFYFNMSVLKPQFLRHRLIVVLFNDRQEYLNFVGLTEKSDMSWSEGLYMQGLNISTFFDASTGSTAASFNKEEETLRARLDALNKQIAAADAQHQKDTAGELMLERNRTGEALARDYNRKGVAIQMNNNTTTLHEAAHQISFNVGIQTRGVDYPLWFSEGLACSFEMEDSVGRRGPAVLNLGRIAEIKELLKKGTLLPIEKLVMQERPQVMNTDTLTVIYAEGWGLFHYLYKTNRAGLEKYLLSYKAPPMLLRTGPEQRRKLFTDAFGDNFDELDKKFGAYVHSLPAVQLLVQ